MANGRDPLYLTVRAVLWLTGVIVWLGPPRGAQVWVTWKLYDRMTTWRDYGEASLAPWWSVGQWLLGVGLPWLVLGGFMALAGRLAAHWLHGWSPMPDGTSPCLTPDMLATLVLRVLSVALLLHAMLAIDTWLAMRWEVVHHEVAYSHHLPWGLSSRFEVIRLTIALLIAIPCYAFAERLAAHTVAAGAAIAQPGVPSC